MFSWKPHLHNSILQINVTSSRCTKRSHVAQIVLWHCC